MTYDVVSVCAQLGSLHVHTPPLTNASSSQHNCRPRNNQCVALVHGALVSSSHAKGHTLSVHALNNERASRNFTAPEAISSLASSHSQTLLFAGASSGRCYVWHVFTGKLLALWDAHVGSVHAASFCDDDDSIVTVGADGAARVFVVSDVMGTQHGRAQACLQLQAHTLAISCVAVGYGGVNARVVTASMDRSARVWHLGSATCIGTVVLSAPAVEVVLSSDESVFFVALSNGYVVCVQMQQLSMARTIACSSVKQIAPVTAHTSVSCMTLSPLDEHLIVGYSDGIVRMYDCACLQMIGAYAKHNSTAAITAVMSAQRGAGCGQRAGALFERVPERMMDASLTQTFVALVERSQGERTAQVAWHVMCHSFDSNFEREADHAERDAERDEQRDASATRHAQRVQREQQLLSQVHSLQRRNQQLHSAGDKLLQAAQLLLL